MYIHPSEMKLNITHTTYHIYTAIQMGLSYNGTSSNSKSTFDQSATVKSFKSDIDITCTDLANHTSPESNNFIAPQPFYEGHPQLQVPATINLANHGEIMDTDDSSDSNDDDANSQDDKSTIYIKHNQTNNNTVGALASMVIKEEGNKDGRIEREPESKYTSQTTYTGTVRVHESQFTESTTFAIELMEANIDTSLCKRASGSNFVFCPNQTGHNKNVDTVGTITTMVIKEDVEEAPDTDLEQHHGHRSLRHEYAINDIEKRICSFG